MKCKDYEEDRNKIIPYRLRKRNRNRRTNNRRTNSNEINNNNIRSRSHSRHSIQSIFSNNNNENYTENKNYTENQNDTENNNKNDTENNNNIPIDIDINNNDITYDTNDSNLVVNAMKDFNANNDEINRNINNIDNESDDDNYFKLFSKNHECPLTINKLEWKDIKIEINI